MREGTRKLRAPPGRVLHEEGRLELQAALVGEVVPRRAVDLVPELEGALQRRAAQIDVAVEEADLLARVDLVGHLERRRLCPVEDGGLDHDDLDLPRGELRVDGADELVLLLAPLLAARAHGAADADDPLAAHRLAERVRVLRHVGVEDDLGHAVAVTQIDEDEAAVIAPALHPSEEDDLLADVGRAQLATAVGALQLVDESAHISSKTRARERAN
jgi:hypothetical protein